jgi:hypothetical protein
MTVGVALTAPSAVLATSVATPVLEWGARAGSVTTVTRGSVLVDVDGSIVAITMGRAPILPNAVGIPRIDVRVVPGSTARLHADGLDAGSLRIRWGFPVSAWEPRVAVGSWRADRIRARGRAILARLGAARAPTGGVLGGGPSSAEDPVGTRAIEDLLSAIRRRNPSLAARASRRLVGLGVGLTPEGDDVLAAVVATIEALWRSAGWSPGDRDALVGAMTEDAGSGRTTALSTTLLALAAQGRPISPVRRLLDLDDETWSNALEQLRGVGNTTGWIYANAVGAAMLALSPDPSEE